MGTDRPDNNVEIEKKHLNEMQENAKSFLAAHGVRTKEEALTLVRRGEALPVEVYFAFVDAATAEETYIYGEHLNYLVRRSDVPEEAVYGIIDRLRAMHEAPVALAREIKFFSEDGEGTIPGSELEMIGLLASNPSLEPRILDDIVSSDIHCLNYVDFVNIDAISADSLTIIVDKICGEDYGPTEYTNFNGYTFLKMANSLLDREFLTQESFDVLFAKITSIAMNSGNERREWHIRVEIPALFEKMIADNYRHSEYVNDAVRSQILVCQALMG